MIRRFIGVAASLLVATIAVGQPIRGLLIGEALDLTARSTTHLAGTFRHAETVIRFDSVREGTNIRFDLRDVAGALVYSITSDTKTYRQTFYDGVLRTTGELPTNSAQFPAPKFTGKRDSLLRFRQSREYRILPFLSRALGANDIFGTTHPASLYIHGLGLANLQGSPPGGPADSRPTRRSRRPRSWSPAAAATA